MSFLLEALRKSENQKNAGSIPTIHSTNDLILRPNRRFRPRLLVLVLSPALVIAGWYAWLWFADTETLLESQKPVAKVVEIPPLDNPPLVKENPERSLPEIPAHPGTSRPLSNERTPVENYDVPVEEVAKTNPEIESIPVAGIPDAITGQTLVADDGQNETISRSLRTIREETQQPQPISFWQLPESIRQSMPDPRITVLVFSERPEDRFILMNGKRYTPGDEVIPGMKLEEVRRDGAVFTFRLYRFLVTR